MRYSIELNVSRIKLILDSDKDKCELKRWLLDDNIDYLDSLFIKCNLDGVEVIQHEAGKINIDSIINLDEEDCITKTIEVTDLILRIMQVKDTTSVRIAEVLELAHHICNRLRKDKSLFMKYDGPYGLTYCSLNQLCRNSSMFVFDMDFDLIYLSQKYQIDDVPDLQLDDTIIKMVDDIIRRQTICSMR